MLVFKRKSSEVARQRRKMHIRKTVHGTTERPRLCVYRSLQNIYAQIIDDTVGNTLVSASSLDLDKSESGGNAEAATKIGKLIGEKAIQSGIKQVVFDRNGYLYHGRVKALADGAREAGLDF